MPVVLATLNARNGDWGSWAIDGTMFVVAAGCILTLLRYKPRS